MLGFDESAVTLSTGQSFAERINPDDLLERQRQLHAHYMRGQPFDCEYRVRLQGGSFGWLHDRGTAEIDHVGRPKRLSGVVRPRHHPQNPRSSIWSCSRITTTSRATSTRSGCARSSIISSRRAFAPAIPAPILRSVSTSFRPLTMRFGCEAADQVLIEGRGAGSTAACASATWSGVSAATALASSSRIAARPTSPFAAGEDPRNRQPHAAIETGAGPIYATISIGSAIFPGSGQDLLRGHDARRVRLDRGEARRSRLLRALSTLGRAAPPPGASVWRSASRCSASPQREPLAAPGVSARGRSR